MYTVMVKKDFEAAHFLISGASGPESKLHTHHYVSELLIEGQELDEQGYLLDIDELNAQLDEQIAYFKNRTLNELPEFEGLNPSLERLARFLCERLAVSLALPRFHSLTVKLWENEQAWAAFRISLYTTAPLARDNIC